MRWRTDIGKQRDPLIVMGDCLYRWAMKYQPPVGGLAFDRHCFVWDSMLCYWMSIALPQAVRIVRKTSGGITINEVDGRQSLSKPVHGLLSCRREHCLGQMNNTHRLYDRDRMAVIYFRKIWSSSRNRQGRPPDLRRQQPQP